MQNAKGVQRPALPARFGARRVACIDDFLMFCYIFRAFIRLILKMGVYDELGNIPLPH